eukprot:NODE_11388_length_1290_cov_4.484953.p1 GENE.NODE_11388_length_1290_cov_4.484953~~NODE_11388_length_1290_cov_4.484953.p1  ORF type:complete len:215 (+),score=36.82 NODE_11388_length_1290_cov_4.484953:443-1087(+)
MASASLCIQMLGEWRPLHADMHVKRRGQPLAALREDEDEDEIEREFDGLKDADLSDVDLESVAGTAHTEGSNQTAPTLSSLAYSFASSALSSQGRASQTDVSYSATTQDTAMQTEERCNRPPLLPGGGRTSGPPPARRRPHKIHLNSSAVALQRRRRERLSCYSMTLRSTSTPAVGAAVSSTSAWRCWRGRCTTCWRARAKGSYSHCMAGNAGR